MVRMLRGIVSHLMIHSYPWILNTPTSFWAEALGSDKEGTRKEELHSDLGKSVMSALASDKLIATADCAA